MNLLTISSLESAIGGPGQPVRTWQQDSDLAHAPSQCLAPRPSMTLSHDSTVSKCKLKSFLLYNEAYCQTWISCTLFHLMSQCRWLFIIYAALNKILISNYSPCQTSFHSQVVSSEADRPSDSNIHYRGCKPTPVQILHMPTELPWYQTMPSVRKARNVIQYKFFHQPTWTEV